MHFYVSLRRCFFHRAKFLFFSVFSLLISKEQKAFKKCCVTDPLGAVGFLDVVWAGWVAKQSPL